MSYTSPHIAVVNSTTNAVRNRIKYDPTQEQPRLRGNDNKITFSKDGAIAEAERIILGWHLNYLDGVRLFVQEN